MSVPAKLLLGEKKSANQTTDFKIIFDGENFS
jgi:hypothetical protein